MKAKAEYLIEKNINKKEERKSLKRLLSYLAHAGDGRVAVRGTFHFRFHSA